MNWFVSDQIYWIGARESVQTEQIRREKEGRKREFVIAEMSWRLTIDEEARRGGILIKNIEAAGGGSLVFKIWQRLK